ncbi:hypothetical protein SLA2020_001880 [Shorea laevis]
MEGNSCSVVFLEIISLLVLLILSLRVLFVVLQGFGNVFREVTVANWSSEWESDSLDVFMQQLFFWRVLSYVEV